MTKEQLLHAMLSQGNLFYSPFIPNPIPENAIISRFLAKVAIEALASICLKSALSLSEIVDNDSLNPLREYARYGNGKFWPYHQRWIYDESKSWDDNQDQKFQILHEYNVISIKQQEYYLVLAIFGLEFTINLGSRNVDSFLQWLSDNQNISPLAFENFPTPYTV